MHIQTAVNLCPLSPGAGPRASARSGGSAGPPAPPPSIRDPRPGPDYRPTLILTLSRPGPPNKGDPMTDQPANEQFHASSFMGYDNAE